MGKVLSTMSKDGFRELPTDAKLVVLFENQQMHLEICTERCEACSKKFDSVQTRQGALERKVEKRKYYDHALSGVSGFAGGFVAAGLKFLSSKVF